MRAERTAGRATALDDDPEAEGRAVLTRARFCHEAGIYRGLAAFADLVLPFVCAGLEADEAVMVVVDEPRRELLRRELGPDAERVRFADMEVVGRNPGRLIPLWRELANDVRGRPFRGVGEAVSVERSAEALIECQHHEQLLNTAIATDEPFWLLCPYDAESLTDSVILEAEASHPLVHDEHGRFVSSRFGDNDTCGALLAAALDEPAIDAHRFDFGAAALPIVRRIAREVGDDAGMSPSRQDDLALALHELATNSVLHGGGTGTLLLWLDHGAVLGEVRDRGRLSSPLVGRTPPEPMDVGGRGLWVVHQLCDLVQVRSTETGTTVRVRVDVS